jgi:hypothetical protein
VTFDSRRSTSLSALRAVYGSIVLALVIFGVVVTVLYGFVRPTLNDGDASLLVLFVLIAAGVVLYVVISLVRRVLVQSLAIDTLAGQFMGITIITVAIAESIALVGLVLSFLTESAIPYLYGLLFALPGIVMAAPTQRSLERLRDEHLPGEDVSDLFRG